MKIVIIDNYDSFTFNLYQYVGELLDSLHRGFVLDVVRNDEISYDDVVRRAYDKIIISPGPGTPADKNYFGICSEILLGVAQKTPTLGICLGMQGLAHCYGSTIDHARAPMHGKVSTISHSGTHLFKGLPQNLEVMRYHSLVVVPDSIPPTLETIARTLEDDPEIMGLRHLHYPIWGVQFHPESFATEGGKQLLENFISL